MRQYKDSGVEWIGKIPETWEYKRFKYSGVFEKGKLPDSSNIDKIGLPIIGASEMLGKDARTYTSDSSVPQCKESDILILWDGANAGITASGLNGVVSSTAVKFTCLDKCILPKYAAYLLKYAEHYFKEKVSGTTIPHMNMAYINDIPLLCPQIVDQQRIADYLDEKCGDIDSLIGLQEQMIEKLNAYKQSVITEAVTKGLDPNAKLVPSGIDWIGEIPEGWKIGRIKNVASLFGRIGFRGYNSNDLNKEGVGAITLSPSNMLPMDMDYSAVTYLSWEKYFESPEIMIQNGDLLYVKTGSSYGKVSYVHDLPREATINPQILRIVPKINNKYLGYYMQSSLCEYQTKIGVVGGTIPTISQEKINNFWVLLPPDFESHTIAAYLDEKCTDIDNLISLKQRKIDSLKEYKKSVIYEAVTGKTIIE